MVSFESIVRITWMKLEIRKTAVPIQQN